MRVTFERVVVVEGSPEKLEKFLGENTFIYWVKGPNGEVWGLAPDFIRERYERHFYLVDFEGESSLLASTVPLKLPVLGNRVARFEGKRTAVARRVKLHLLDPLRKFLSLQRSSDINLVRALYRVFLYLILLWFLPYLLLVVIPITLLEFVPGNERIVLREGSGIRVLSRGRRAFLMREILIGMWFLVVGVGLTLYRAYTGQENPGKAVFMSVLLIGALMEEYLRLKGLRYGFQQPL